MSRLFINYLVSELEEEYNKFLKNKNLEKVLLIHTELHKHRTTKASKVLKRKIEKFLEAEKFSIIFSSIIHGKNPITHKTFDEDSIWKHNAIQKQLQQWVKKLAFSKIENSSDKKKKEWSEEELEAAVLAYQEMWQYDNKKIKYTKKRIYEELSNQFSRTVKSFEYRMQNISYVYKLMGKRLVKGLKPKENVGKKNIDRIKILIEKNNKMKKSDVKLRDIKNR